MNLSIYISGYLGSRLKDTTHSGSGGVFRFGNKRLIPSATDELLLNAIGYNTDDHIPLAALLKKAENEVDTVVDSSSHYLLAQPVNLLLQRDSFGMSEVVRLAENEYEILTRLLNKHFNMDGIVFEKSDTLQYWFVKFPASVNASTFPIQAVMHQNINSLLPFGPDAKQLLAVINQSQMLLHEHDVNIEREAKRQVSVNSLWLSGEGVLLARPNAIEAYTGEGTLLKSILAIKNKNAYSDIDELISSQVKQAVAVFEDVDQIDWGKVFNRIKSWKIRQVEVYLPVENSTLHIVISPWDCWKFWRRSKNKNVVHHEN